MKLIDIKKLKYVRKKPKYLSGGGLPEKVIIAQCPACKEDAHDLNGRNHLIVYPSGGFACVVNLGDRDHNKRILELVGTEKPRDPNSFALLRQRRRPRPLISPVQPKITYIQLKRPCAAPQPETLSHQ